MIYGSEYLISAPIEVNAESGSLTLSGVVKSKGSDSDTVKVELAQFGKTVKTLSLIGNSVRFVFNGLEKGTYTLKVDKNGHKQYSATIIQLGRCCRRGKICQRSGSGSRGKQQFGDQLDD